MGRNMPWRLTVVLCVRSAAEKAARLVAAGRSARGRFIKYQWIEACAKARRMIPTISFAVSVDGK